MESTSNSPSPIDSETPASTNNVTPDQPNVISPSPLTSTPAPSAQDGAVIEPSAATTLSTAPLAADTAQPEPTTNSSSTSETPGLTPPDSPAIITPQVAAPAPTEPPHPPRTLLLKKLLLASLGLLVIAAIGIGGYLLGKHTTKPTAMSTTTQQTAMAVPKDATVIEQCSPGFGTQYVLPKDIPGGPVYNVYQGKLIGIEYMTAITSAGNPDLMLKDLPLFAQKYDHVDIMTMPAHAGFPKPHYQVDVMMVPTSVSSKITCGSSSSDMSNSSMGSSSNTTKSSMSSNMAM